VNTLSLCKAAIATNNTPKTLANPTTDVAIHQSDSTFTHSELATGVLHRLMLCLVRRNTHIGRAGHSTMHNTPKGLQDSALGCGVLSPAYLESAASHFTRIRLHEVCVV
jgi:hypothetical protein